MDSNKQLYIPKEISRHQLEPRHLYAPRVGSLYYQHAQFHHYQSLFHQEFFEKSYNRFLSFELQQVLQLDYLSPFHLKP